MRQKCDGWKEEVDRLTPYEEEVKKLRKENEELAQQVTMMVEEGERKEALAAEGGGGGSGVMDYDVMMKRMDELQDTRVTMEGELCQIREERAAILQENAALREGSLPQNYTNLKTKYEGILNVLRETEVALNEEKSVKLELHRKLVSATDPQKLKSISERMVRYKNERDIAKSELEEAQSRLIAAEINAKSAQDFSHPKMSAEGYAQAKPKGDSCLYHTVRVRTAGGQFEEKDIQKPSTRLNPRQQPQVVVKRDTGYETGTLAFVGMIGGKELAGVILDSRLQCKCNAVQSHLHSKQV